MAATALRCASECWVGSQCHCRHSVVGVSSQDSVSLRTPSAVKSSEPCASPGKPHVFNFDAVFDSDSAQVLPRHVP